MKYMFDTPVELFTTGVFFDAFMNFTGVFYENLTHVIEKEKYLLYNKV